MEKNIRVHKIKGTAVLVRYLPCEGGQENAKSKATRVQFVEKFYRYLFSNLEWHVLKLLTKVCSHLHVGTKWGPLLDSGHAGGPDGERVVEEGQVQPLHLHPELGCESLEKPLLGRFELGVNGRYCSSQSSRIKDRCTGCSKIIIAVCVNLRHSFGTVKFRLVIVPLKLATYLNSCK